MIYVWEMGVSAGGVVRHLGDRSHVFRGALGGAQYPPAITHAELYYGFAGVTLAWQIVYLLISTDPERHRPLMLVGVFAKSTYIIAALCLYLQHRIAAGLASSAFGDLFWVVLFIASYLRTPAKADYLRKKIRARDCARILKTPGLTGSARSLRPSYCPPMP